MTPIQELRALSNSPQANASIAISLLKNRKKPDVILAALATLAEQPAPEARQPILELYAHYAANGPKRDPGAYTRRAILNALRPVALPMDVPLLNDAVTTYEFLPPSFREDAVLLRAGALLILNDIEDELARYHSARLLVDGFTHEMSGEPALTAVRVLESQNQLVSIYQFVMSDTAPALADVVSKGLQALVGLPVELIPSLIERHGESANGLVLVGLFDLLVKHPDGPQELDFIASSLLSQRDLDVFRYLVFSLLSTRQPILISVLKNIAQMETNAGRIKVFIEAAELYKNDPDIAGIASALREKNR